MANVTNNMSSIQESLNPNVNIPLGHNFWPYPTTILSHQMVTEANLPLLTSFPTSHLNRVVSSPTATTSWSPNTHPITQHYMSFPTSSFSQFGISQTAHQGAPPIQSGPCRIEHWDYAKSILVRPDTQPPAQYEQGMALQSTPGIFNEYAWSCARSLSMHWGTTDGRGTSRPNASPTVLVPLPKMPKSSFQIGYYVPPRVDPGDPFGGLTEVWTRHFELLFNSFSSFRHCWSFGPTNGPLNGWSTYRDMAKVRFACQQCRNGWTSMHGVVVFYYKLEAAKGRGQVRFVLTGQKCSQCSNDNFETPMWYPEEAQKAMTNLYHEIASKVYNLETPPPIKDRRHGRPRQQHVVSSCQGCFLGLCKPANSTTTSISLDGSTSSDQQEEA